MGQIDKKDIISFETVIVFYYKNCEVTLRKYDEVTVIKIVGLSDMGSILVDSHSFIKKYSREDVKCLLDNEIKNIEKVYKSIASNEYGKNFSFS